MKNIQFGIFRINLNPTKGSEQQGERPCVVISPDEINLYLNTVIIAPMTTTFKSYPTRIYYQHTKPCQIMLDQIRTIDKSRLSNYEGHLDPQTAQLVSDGLITLFTL